MNKYIVTVRTIPEMLAVKWVLKLRHITVSDLDDYIIRWYLNRYGHVTFKITFWPDYRYTYDTNFEFDKDYKQCQQVRPVQFYKWHKLEILDEVPNWDSPGSKLH